ncbi:hypothetical protein [Flexivirga caeni]|uniref:Uncharacterized protein n=1 Tax=Flexivirga caeni TaxID=2294115 RepID=A0A3M9MEZ6_9MICO|nr:hypothetical protein [Flexivirga caeni]RNI23208.1 hypothetical protein EFY87_07170 [Flexivirga caeni]
MQTSDRTRGVALLVPRLLSIQTDPAEFETAEACADAIERAAEELLRWHDELAELRVPRAPVSAHLDAVLPDPATSRPARASKRLAEQVRAGAIPADAASLEDAATELHRVAEAIRRTAACGLDEPIRKHGNDIADALSRLSVALRTLAETLRAESRRLAEDVTGQADQVLGRVVRAEHATRIVAAATLPG